MIKTPGTDMTPVTVNLFGNSINELVDQSEAEITEISLLKASPFNLVYKNGFVRSITR